MDELQRILQEIIVHYAHFNPVTNSYDNQQKTLDPQEIEAHLIAVFSQFLIKKGLNEENINGQKRVLQLFFHPDKYALAKPEVKWLESNLNDNNHSRDFCFKLIANCAEEIKHSNQKKPNVSPHKTSYEFSSLEQLIETLINSKASATTLTQQKLISSLIFLLESRNLCNSRCQQVKNDWLKVVMKSLPYITSGFCIGLYLKELSLLYALAFTLSKGGQLLEHSNNTLLQLVGYKANIFGYALEQSASTLLACLAGVNLLAWSVGIQTGANLYKRLMILIPNYLLSPASLGTKTAFPSSFTISPQSLLSGRNFKTLSLKIISIPLELYLSHIDRQYLSTWRQGCTKRAFMQKLLDTLVALDASELTEAAKIEQAQYEVTKLACVQVVNVSGSYAAKTIDNCKVLCSFFSNSNLAKLSNDKANTPLTIEDTSFLML